MSAERNRRYRQRQKLDLAVLPVEVHLPSLVEALMNVGRLPSRRHPTFAEVVEAASGFLADSLRDASLGRPPGRR